jgi:hypothetical protein
MEGTQQLRFFEFHESRLVLRIPPINVGGDSAVGIIAWNASNESRGI